MIFLFKPKKIHLDCFTTYPEVYEFNPIVNGSKCYPDWWKSLPNGSFDFSEFTEKTTMKQCVGFTDFFRTSATLKMWTDFAIKVEHPENRGINYRYKYSHLYTELISHPPEQYNGFVDGNYLHLKLFSPWAFRTKEDINWVCVGNPYSKNLSGDLIITPGILNFKYQCYTNIQAFLKCEVGQSVNRIFETGMPLMNFFPMSERKVEIHNHLISDEEMMKVTARSKPLHFLKKYIKNRNIIKNSEKKCPFHF